MSLAYLAIVYVIVLDDGEVITCPNQPASDKLTKAARGEDKPLDEKQPTAPFALVLGSYPIILVLALLFILLVSWLMRNTPA